MKKFDRERELERERVSAERDEIEESEEDSSEKRRRPSEFLPSLRLHQHLFLSSSPQRARANEAITNLSTRARRSELFRASPLPPWETRRRWSEPLLPEAVMTPPDFADGGRSTDVRPPLVFVLLLLLLPPLTRMGLVFSS